MGGHQAPRAATPIRTWVVYPERKEKAGVVIVIHEIFGLTDWIRGVADQLAADGFIAVAPDLLSGRGPGGGGTDRRPSRENVARICAHSPPRTSTLASTPSAITAEAPRRQRQDRHHRLLLGRRASFATPPRSPTSAPPSSTTAPPREAGGPDTEAKKIAAPSPATTAATTPASTPPSTTRSKISPELGRPTPPTSTTAPATASSANRTAAPPTEKPPKRRGRRRFIPQEEPGVSEAAAMVLGGAPRPPLFRRGASKTGRDRPSEDYVSGGRGQESSCSGLLPVASFPLLTRPPAYAGV